MRGVRAVLALALVAGCAESPPYGEVTGVVTLDDQPLKEGVVRFIPIDGKSATASALIADGKFSERVPVGTHRVEISAPRLPSGLLSSKQMKRGTIDENVALEELIPARYNLQSKLTTEVKSGKNRPHFPLKSK